MRANFKNYILRMSRSGHPFPEDQMRFVEVVLHDWNCPDIRTWEQLDSYVRTNGGDDEMIGVAADLFNEWKGFK